MSKDKLFLLLAIGISTLGILSLSRPGFFLTDDGNSMVIRFSAFYETFRFGQFPVRFLERLNYGFGYPVADFLYPLFMYIGVPIKALGFSFVDTIKIILGLSFLSGTIFSFLWLRKMFEERSAFVGSIIYSLFPYHLYDLYKRGSVGEVLALGILPFILWQVERRSLFWGAIGIFLLILAHNTLAILFIILILFYGLLDVYVQKNRKQLAGYYMRMLLIGLGLSSFFSIPAIFDLQYTIFSKTPISDWSKYFIDFNLVGLSTAVIFITILIFILVKKIDPKKHRLTILMLVIGILSIFFASSISSFIWNFLPSFFIQFPFRFLSLTIVSTAFLGAVLISVSKGTQKWVIGGVLLLLSLYSSKQFLAPSVFQNYPDTFYSTNQDSTTVKNEYMPKWVREFPVKMAEKRIEIIKGKGNIQGLHKNKFEIELSEKSLMQINIIYFPGWEVVSDGKPQKISFDNKYGIIQFEQDKGRHFVEAKFKETNIRLFSDVVSVLSFILLLFVAKRNVKIF